MSKAPPKVAPAYPIASGLTVRFNGGDAVIYETKEAGNPRSDVSLVYKDFSDGGRERIARDVPYGPGLGQWITRAELEADRPLTPLEEVAKARAEGRRAPEPGMVVYFARSEGPSFTCQVAKRRLRVTQVHSLTEIDGVILAHRGDDPDAEDVPIALHGLVRNSKHASLASDWSKEEYFIDHWCYVDEEFIADTEPTSFLAIHPPHVCAAPACGNKCTHIFAIEVGQMKNGAAAPLEVCEVCRGNVREILGLPRDPVAAPSAVFAFGGTSKAVEPSEADLAAMEEAESVAADLEARTRARHGASLANA